MTIGTSIICGSFLEESSLLFFTFTCHTPPRHSSSLSWRGFESVRQSCWLSGLVIQKIEGLFAADSVPDSVSSGERRRRFRDSTPRLPPRFLPVPRCVPVTTTTLHPALPGHADLPAGEASPSSSCLRPSCPEPPGPASRVPAEDQFAGLPTLPVPQNHYA